jgi:hypothetical protein
MRIFIYPTILSVIFLILRRIQCDIIHVPIPVWPRGLRRGSAAARLLGLWVRIPPEACTSVCFECCVLSGRDLWVGLITRPEESYWVLCVWEWSWTFDNEEAHWRLLCIQTIIINVQYIGLHVKYPTFVSDFNETQIFPTKFWKK